MKFGIAFALIVMLLCSCAGKLEYIPKIDFKATQYYGKKLTKDIFVKDVLFCQEWAVKYSNESKWWYYSTLGVNILGTFSNIFYGAATGTLPETDDELSWGLIGASAALGGMETYSTMQQAPKMDPKSLMDECMRQKGYTLKQGGVK